MEALNSSSNLKFHSTLPFIVWFVIFWLFQTTYQESEAELVCFCLGVIGAYVAWIDISLIANDKFVQVMLKQICEHTQ